MIFKAFPDEKIGGLAILLDELQFPGTQEIVHHGQRRPALGYAKDHLDGPGRGLLQDGHPHPLFHPRPKEGMGHPIALRIHLAVRQALRPHDQSDLLGKVDGIDYVIWMNYYGN